MSGNKENIQPTYKELSRELSKQQFEVNRLKAENERKDNVIANLVKVNGRYRKKAHEQIEESKKNAVEKESINEEFEAVKKELSKVKTSKSFVTMLGMTEEDADEAAEAEISGDMDKWQAVIQRHIEKIKMDAENEAREFFLKNRPDIKAGLGDVDRNASALAMAVAYVSGQGADMDIINQY